jgi:hypothetical protein
MSRLSHKTLTVVVAATLSLCSYVALSKTLKSLKSLDEDEVVLVGRIELVPPLEEFEQNLKTIGSKRYKNAAMFVIGERPVDVQNPGLRDGKHADRVTFGKDFYLRRKRNDTLIYSGSIILTQSSMVGHGRRASVDVERLILPGGLKYEIQASDKAVYIGTFRYHRDDYNAITKVDLLNEFDKANKTFAERFGNGVKLRHVKPSLVK